MDTPEPRPVPVLRPPPRRRRRPRRYLTHLALPPDLHPDPPATPLPLLHRVLSGLHALPAAPPVSPARPTAGWKCPAAGCLWESINPISRPCPFPPSADADGVDPGTATLADLTRRLLARNPSLGAPPEEREPSPDVVVTQALPVVAGPVVVGPVVVGPVVPAQGGGR